VRDALAEPSKMTWPARREPAESALSVSVQAPRDRSRKRDGINLNSSFRL
jgi:hypothetical protein